MRWSLFLSGAFLASVYTHVHAQTTSDILRASVLHEDSATTMVQQFLVSQFPSFPNPSSQSEWEGYAARVRDTLRTLLTHIPVSERTPHRIESRGTLHEDGYRIEKLILEIYEGIEIPVNIYIPDSLDGRTPIVLNPNGFFLEGKAMEAIQRRCASFAKMGYVAISWDFVHTGERGGWDGIGLPGNNGYYSVWWRIAGANSIALSVGETMAILEYVMTLPYVDTTRIAAVGSSQGAITALLAASIDQRISAVVGVVPSMPSKKAPFTLTDHFTERNYIMWDGAFTPSLFKEVADMAELIALCAPRKVLIISGTSDITPPAWIGEEVEQARQIYDLVGNPDALKHDSLQMGHEYGLAARLRTYGWLRRWFDNDTNEVLSESEINVWPLDSLRCGINPTSSTILSSGNALLSAISKPNYLPTSAQEARLMQHEIQTSFVDIAHRFSDSVLSTIVLGTMSYPAMTITRGVLNHESKLKTPFLFFSPVGMAPEAGVILLSDSGKGALPGTLVDSLVARGYSVCAFDPLGTGEIAFERFSTRVLSYYMEMFDHTLISVGRHQVDEVIRLMKRQGMSRVAIVADGPLSQVLATLAATSDDVGSLAVSNGLDGYQESLPGEFPMKAPAFKQFKNSFRTADTPILSSIISPKPSLFSNMRDLDGGLLPDSSRTLGMMRDFHGVFGKDHLLTQVLDSSGSAEKTFEWLLKVYPPFGRLNVFAVPDSVVMEDSSYTTALLTNHSGDQFIEIVDGPEWLSINSETGRLSGVALNHGQSSQPVRIRVTTDTGDTLEYRYDLHVIHQNHPPDISAFPDTLAFEDSLYTHAIQASDRDTEYFGDSLSYHLIAGPMWMQVDSIAGVLSGTPLASDVGDTVGTLMVTDRNGGVALQQFRLKTYHTNHAPVFITQPVTSASEDSLYQYYAYSMDVDSILFGDKIKYSLLGEGGWLFVDSSTGLLSGTPRIYNLADTLVTIVATDDSGAVAEQSFVIRVQHVNHQPVIQSIPVLKAVEDSTYRYAVVATDVDTLVGDSLQSTLIRAPAWLIFDSLQLILHGVPGAVDIGLDTVEIVVSDLLGATVRQEYQLLTRHVNHAPFFVSVPETVAVESLAYRYMIRALDPDSLFDDVIQYRAITKPAWLTFDNSSGELKGLPMSQDVGEYQVVITARDKSGSTVVQDFNLNVKYMNHNPVITTFPVISAQEDSQYVYQVQALDSDSALFNDHIKYRLETGASWLMIDSVSGRLAGIPRGLDVGIRNVVVIAVDQQGAMDRQEFMLRVEHTNHAPRIVSVPVTGATEDELYEYRVVAIDQDSLFGDGLRYRLNIGPIWLSMDSISGLISGSPAGVNAKDTVVEVEVVDIVRDETKRRGDAMMNSAGAFGERGLGPRAMSKQFYRIHITHVNHAPMFVSIPETTVVAGTEYRYAVHILDPDSIDQADTISCELDAGPEFLRFDKETFVLTGSPGRMHSGRYRILLVARDNHGKKSYQDFTLNVLRSKRLREILTTRDTVILESSSFEFRPMTARNNSGEERYRYHLLGGPGWIAVDSMTGTISGKWPSGDGNSTIDVLLVAISLEGNVIEEHVILQTKPGGGGEFEHEVKEFALVQNYPNPFNPTTVITYSVAEASYIKLTIINILGQAIETVIDQYQDPGRYSVVWPASDGSINFPDGVYFYRLDAVRISDRMGWSEVRKMVLLK
ncbi:MAG: putative Ig domain-containing protein [Bacteroidota bacterium]